MTIQDQLNKDVLREFKTKFKVIIENALKVRGHSFKTSEELKYFLINHCEAVRDGDKVKYLVNGQPFLIFTKKVELDFDPSKGCVFVMEFGEYKFIKR